MRGRLRSAALALLPAIVLITGTGTPAHAAGDYGPDTCLQGYVWREAFPNDHVCVAPDVRTLAAYDNSLAAVRRSPTGGLYGPDTCLPGWVWREASTTDHVCVAVPTRAQAAADNAQAAARRDSELLWHGTYTNPPVCDGDTCSVTSIDGIPRLRLFGDHINLGRAVVELRTTAGILRQSWTVDTVAAGGPGGRFSLDTGVFQCPGPVNSYFRVYDPVSTRWSAPDYVTTGCLVL